MSKRKLTYREWIKKNAGCIGKQAMSFEVACLVARKSPAALHPYKCEFCGQWHVGNELLRRRKS
jgi:hypothetical protein